MSLNFFKVFTLWFDLKPKLDSLKHRPLFKEREVWMCRLGLNIGFEMDGKNQEFLRPIIVYKKLSANTFLGIPLTSKEKTGSWFSPSNINGSKGSFCLNQIRLADSKRLKYPMGQIDSNDFAKLKEDFYSMLERTS